MNHHGYSSWRAGVLGLLGSALLGGPVLWAEIEQEGDGPLISHDPVKVAVEGQPVSLLAKVTPKGAAVKEVTLHYTLSRHSAPQNVEMQPTGMGLYTGTIPADVLRHGETLHYYIEAEGIGGSWTETSWQAVEIRDQAAGDTGEAVPAAIPPVTASPARPSVRPRTVSPQPLTTSPVRQPAPAVATPSAEPVIIRSSSKPRTPSRTKRARSDDETNWGTMALIGGAGVGVAAAAIALSSDNGGSGGNNTTDTTNTGDSSGTGGPTSGTDGSTAGTYTGETTLCERVGGGPEMCNTTPTTIVIDEGGTVTSNDLEGSTPVMGQLVGGQFSITVPANQIDPNAQGQVTYTGTVDNGIIFGRISGDAESTEGTRIYSGTFNATR